MTNLIQRFWNDEEGATAIEYGLIAGLIAVAIIASVGQIGERLKAFFEYIVEQLGTGAVGGGTGGGSTGGATGG
ncbi:Flp family type IVb pilin [Comamonas endophytica]|uniref:Flp family type IVb pilin n=1 Tax=Comamonas endophytica TaxID=2949090 RepID=A0ABY6GBT2_9BURK|nr:MULTISPECIES: Flp family type IVb pilin [unclassified Acidovorax]MCD2512146.1 Flp family type IVb pilin [Acidovorax sp. D4N7]UYG51919.1 Flp family type IVb pilin [Acidovorax sp. 5MLIR]